LTVNGFSTISIKTKIVDDFRNLALCEENTLSKQLRIMCELYTKSKKSNLLNKTKGDEIVNSN